MHFGTKFSYLLPHIKDIWKLSVLKILDLVSNIWSFSLHSYRLHPIELLFVFVFVELFFSQNTGCSVSSCRTCHSQGLHRHWCGASGRQAGQLPAALSQAKGSGVPGTRGAASHHQLPSGSCPGRDVGALGLESSWKQPLFLLLPHTCLFNALFSSKMLLVKGGGRRSQAIIC